MTPPAFPSTAINSARKIWLAALAVIATSGGLEIFTSWDAHQRVAVDARERVGADARLIEAQMASLLRNIDSTLNQVVLETTQNGSCEQLQIQRFGRLFPEFYSITVIDRQGINLCASRTELIGLDQSAYDYFNRERSLPRANVMTIEKPMVSSTSGIPILILRKSVVSAAGQLRFIVQVSIDLRHFDRFLRPLQRNAQAVFIVHDSGLLLSRQPDPELFRFKDVSESFPAFSEHRQGGQSSSTHRVKSALDGTRSGILTLACPMTGDKAILRSPATPHALSWQTY